MTEKQIVFVTGGSGFIGSYTIDELVKQNRFTVYTLSRSLEQDEAYKRKGALPLRGDLLSKNNTEWENIAATADFIIHCAQPAVFDGKKFTLQRALKYEKDRFEMDERIIQAGVIPNKRLKCMIYVSGLSYYGDSGEVVGNEESTNPPRGFGPYIKRTVDHVMTKYVPNYNIISVFPGGVYGYGNSMLHTALIPMAISGIPFMHIDKPRKLSFIHVEDCARALIYLAEHGEMKNKYILVDNVPCTTLDITQHVRKELQLPAVSTLQIPHFLCKQLLGEVLYDYSLITQVYSNQKLKSSGFQFLYPTIHEGVPQVLDKIGRDSLKQKYFQNQKLKTVLLFILALVFILAVLILVRR